MNLFKKVSKKITFVFSLVFLITSLGSFCAFADDGRNDCKNLTIQHEDNVENGISPRKVISCPNSPSQWHEAYFKGYGTLYKGMKGKNPKQIFNCGYLFQCAHCYETIITQNHPNQSDTIGYYGLWNPLEPVYALNKIPVYTNEVLYTSNYYVTGYNFHNNSSR